MKKTLSIILAVMLLLGLSATAFADDKSVTVKATKEQAPITYEIVIPEEIETITEPGMYSIGSVQTLQAQNYTQYTRISCTVTTTNLINDDNPYYEIPVTYTADQFGEYPLEEGRVFITHDDGYPKESVSLYIYVDGYDWYNAVAGNYTATVTYNFKSEECEPIGAILSTTDFPSVDANCGYFDFNNDPAAFRPDNSWKNSDGSYEVYEVKNVDESEYLVFLASDGECCCFERLHLSEEDGNMVCIWCYEDKRKFTFVMEDGVLQSIVVEGTADNEYYQNIDGTYAPAN